MRKKVVVIFFLLAILFSLASLSLGFNNNANKINPDDKQDTKLREYTHENAVKPINKTTNQEGYYGGHDTITNEAMLLKQEVHRQTDNDGGADFIDKMLKEALPSLRIGAHDEDATKIKITYPVGNPILDIEQTAEIPLDDPPIGQTGWGSFFYHFYDYNKTKKGLKGWGTPAPQRAEEYVGEIKKIAGCTPGGISNLNGENKKKVYEYFGKSLHLLQDMAVPSHTKDDMHPFTKPFENYVNDHWDQIVNSQAFKEKVTVDKYLNGNYKFTNISDYWDSLAKISSAHPNEEELYDQIGESDMVLNQAKLKKNLDDLIPEAILHTAGYIDGIYDYITGKTNDEATCAVSYHFLGPGGDHPDDRFDVSDEFYWEKEYNLSEADLADFYMRTAMKKGKIGVWYWKRYREIYATALTQYADASQDVRDRITLEFKAMGKKLEERSNFAESDWKGAPDIALFTYGYYDPSISLLMKYKEPVAFKGLDFDPSMVKDHPVMVIPSGGLYGLENSTFLKAQLDEYVKQGGTLIVFAQQHGYEFSVLPIPVDPNTGQTRPIRGYGWAEDQSCLWNGTYIDTNHQLLSAIVTSTVSANVDGYFTSYPDNSTILLRRTVNGQPAMLMYDYGLGKVIVSSLFSDWGHAHSQATQDEIKIVRDMIFWAKKPVVLAEIKPGESVSLTMDVRNSSATDAASVKLYVYNPDRTAVVSEQTVAANLPAGSSVQLVAAYSAPITDALGIYHIDFELYDANGNISQPQAETDSGRFAVSSPPTANPYIRPDFNFSINSDSEQYAYGSDAIFTVTIWNNGDTDRTITANYLAYHLNVTGSPQTIVVPGHSSISFQVIASNITHEGWVVVNFYDENNGYIGQFWKGIWMFRPDVNVTVKSDKSLYTKGDPVTLTLDIKNKQNIDYMTLIKVKVSDQSNANIFSTVLNVDLTPNVTKTQISSFVLPASAQGGFYTVSIEAYDASGRKIGGDSTSFELPLSLISITPQIPVVFNSGANTVSFNLVNFGRIPVSSGMLNVVLKDPDGFVVSTDMQLWSLDTDQSDVLEFPLTIPTLKFGKYILTYSQSDETRAGQTTAITISNAATIAFSLDKSSYRIRETADIILNLGNTGSFNLNGISFTMAIPDIGYTETKSITLPQAGNSQIFYDVPIPETVTAGQHDITVTLALPDNSLVHSSIITIPESSLTLGYSGAATITAGDIVSLTIENMGGVDTTYATEEFSLRDNRGIVIYEKNITDTILAGEKKTLSDIPIPAQIAKGSLFLNLKVKDGKTSKLYELYKALEITGLTATLQVRTTKDAYFKTEPISGITHIANGGFNIDEGSLKIAVTKMRNVDAEFISQWGSYGTEPGQFNLPRSVTTDDAFIYVTEYYNHRVTIYKKSDHSYVAAFGSFGTMNGQFNSPQGIAVDNAYIYVADVRNNRIQIFNKSNFAFAGKFSLSLPYYIAVDDSNIYVASQSYVRIYNKNNYLYEATLPGQFYHPYGIAIDNSKIYAADVYNHRVQIFDKLSHVFLGKFGSFGSGDGQFNTAASVAVDDSYIYVGDNSNRVQIFDKNSYKFIYKFGSSGTGDGQFSAPYGIVVESDGTIYITDSGNHRIQKLRISHNTVGSIFETIIPITQSASTSRDYSTNIGTLNTTGKLYLQAELKNSLGQTVATSGYPLCIVEGNTILSFNTDKKIYKPGEIITITGEVRNIASITASSLSLQLSTNGQNIYSAAFDVPAKSSYPFTVTATAFAEGTFILTGKVTQNTSILAELADQYEVASPKVTALITLPDITGNDPFDIDLDIKNEGKADASIQFSAVSSQGTIDSKQMAIQSGERKLIQYNQQIASDSTYTFTFTGDLEQTVAKTVPYGLSASISVAPQAVYPEGKIAIPVTITNTGQLDETLNVVYSFQPLTLTATKTYFIPTGRSITDTLYYEVTEGSYQLSAISNQPSAAANTAFSVRKENQANMTVSVSSRNDELIPVTVNLTNLGYNEINGSVQLSIISTQGTIAWNGSQDINQLTADTSYSTTFNISLSAIKPGDYTLKAELLDISNQQMAIATEPLTIRGPVFQIIQLPPYQAFTVGQETAFTFKIKNTGNQAGAAELNLKAYDLTDATQREWLEPGEEKQIYFSFILPDDLETNDYFADYELKIDNSQQSIGKGQVKYHVAGISLNVSATLDKQNYRQGETARLTVNIKSPSPNPQALFARVNYAGYENQQTFVLNGSRTLTFAIPLAQITGEKLFYGIYHESGRSIHLNSLYIYKTGDVIAITTNKQVYNTGETVFVSVNGNTSGAMILTGPNYSEEFTFSGTASRSFVLPSILTAGTYGLTADLSAIDGTSYTESHSIDVAGIQVKVLEFKNNKGKYASTDTITTNFTISSNTAMGATLKTWIVDPAGKYANVGESSINLLSSEPLLLTYNYSLFSIVSGIHRLVYGIYSGDLLLVSGSEAFDVGDAMLLDIATDKTDYSIYTEPVKVKTSMFGKVSANLELQLDGATVKSDSVSLDGFSTLDIDLGDVSPGTHVLKGILTAGGLKSAKETSFIYGSSLPDLTTELTMQSAIPDQSNTVKARAMAVNQGKIPSSITTIKLYDGGTLIETKQVNALNASESQEITFIWNVFGKTGEHAIKAVIDPDNAVIEFSESNNTSTKNVVIPDITLLTGTDKDAYKIRQNVNILSALENLSSGKVFDSLTIVTTAKNPLGNEAFTNTVIVTGIQPLSVSTNTVVWNTNGLNADGIYTICQKVLSGDQVLAQDTKFITLHKISDFNIKTDTDYNWIKQGQKTTYTIYLEPLDGWSSEITLNLQGLPAGTSVSFNSDNLVPPGQALTTVITTDATPAGKYTLNLVAEGMDEDEAVTHALPLSLDIAGFALEALPANITMKQLETSVLDVNLHALNGYEGEVTLSLEGLPHGIRALFDSAKSTVPGEAKLRVQTSKFVKPGIYKLTITGNDGLVKHALDLVITTADNPEISAGIITTPGPGPKNPASVSLISKELKSILDFTVFNSKYGANVVSADIDGDGFDEIITAPGPDPKAKARIRVYRRDGSFMFEQTIFDAKYGLTVAAGDFNGDWKDELVVGMGPGPKNQTRIAVLNFDGSRLIDTGIDFNAFSMLKNEDEGNHKYGVNVAAGDVDGDKIPELVASPGFAHGSPVKVKVFKIDTSSGIGLWKVSEVYSEFDTATEKETEPHGEKDKERAEFGCNIAAGDIDGDNIAEIIVGAGPDRGNASLVKIFKGDGTFTGISFIAYPDTGQHHKHEKRYSKGDNENNVAKRRYRYGVYVSAVDLDGDGVDEIITGLGPGRHNPSWVKVFKADGSEVESFLSYQENTKYGVKVFTGRVGD